MFHRPAAPVIPYTLSSAGARLSDSTYQNQVCHCNCRLESLCHRLLLQLRFFDVQRYKQGCNETSGQEGEGEGVWVYKAVNSCRDVALNLWTTVAKHLLMSLMSALEL